jgi:hypothetical protein
MSGDSGALRARIPTYAGHDSAQARRLTDQQVRAYAGEALVDLQDRLTLDGVRDRFDKLLMRCEFGDQHVIKALEGDLFAEADTAAAIEAEDLKLVEAASRLKSTDAGGLDAVIGDLERAFDERAAAVSGRLKR